MATPTASGIANMEEDVNGATVAMVLENDDNHRGGWASYHRAVYMVVFIIHCISTNRYRYPTTV